MKLFFALISCLLISQPGWTHEEGHDHDHAAVPPIAGKSVAGTGHLKFAQGRWHAHLSWLQAPTTQGEAKMRLEWHDGKTHALVEPGRLFTVKLHMPSMKHGSAPTKIEKMKDDKGQEIPGTYEVSNMRFMMSGDWVVRVFLNNATDKSAAMDENTAEMQEWSVVAP